MFHGSLMNIMGTRLDVLMIGEEKLLSLLWEDIVSEAERLHRMLNRFNPGSEISHVNAHAVSHPVKVNDELWTILVDIKKYHQSTLGYFDATLRDYNLVILDENNQTVVFADKTILLDMGGYAKGYALGKMQKMLLQAGVRQALVNFGNSSVVALGTHPHGNCWSIGIEDPFHPGRQLKVFELCDTSLSTSGNTTQHTNHIIDPHSGKYMAERKLVSVIFPNCVDAEILSTALSVADNQSIEAIKKSYNNAICCIFAL